LAHKDMLSDPPAPPDPPIGPVALGPLGPPMNSITKAWRAALDASRVAVSLSDDAVLELVAAAACAYAAEIGGTLTLSTKDSVLRLKCTIEVEEVEFVIGVTNRG